MSRAMAMAMSPIVGNAVSASTNRMRSRVLHTEFMSWLKSRGENVDSIAVTIGMSGNGRALFASRPICVGERLMRFTQNLELTPGKLPKEVISLLREANDHTRLSLLLLAEQNKGQESAWAPYINCLPSFGELQSTVFWDDEELACLECSPLYSATHEKNSFMLNEYNEVKHVVESCPHIYHKRVSLEQFIHVYSIVSSRAWGKSRHSNMSMIPLLDFANHNPWTRTILSDDFFSTTVVSDRDYQSGDEVNISYGKLSNVVLALNHGFVFPSNPFDQAEIWLEIPYEDPLREVKLQYLIQNKMPMLDGSQSGKRSFPIMAVDLPAGKEISVPSAARAYSRVICSDSVEDLQELKNESEIHWGAPFAFRPRQDASKEMKAMAFLLSVIQSHIDQHQKALQNTHKISRPERLQIAESVLYGELHLLEKCSSWLKDRCKL